MASQRLGTRLAYAAALALALGSAAARGEQPAAREPHPFWRQLFARPANAPAQTAKPTTPEMIALGRRLFRDTRLSGSGRIACATCHDPARGFTDGRRKSRAFPAGELARNTPTLWNIGWAGRLFWDGRAATLEEQARFPIEARDEMAGDWPEILRRLAADAGITTLAARAFPAAPTLTDATVIEAIAAYERSIVSAPTRFDRWIGGDRAALSAREVRGFDLFKGRAGCVVCHSGWRFTDDRLHDIGLAQRAGDRPASGPASGTPWAFKTPSLRGLGLTAPYMHDGSLATLEAVLEHYTGRFVPRPSLAANFKRDLRLDAREKADLIAFLRTISSEQAQPSRLGGWRR